MEHALTKLALGKLSPAGQRARLAVFCYHRVLVEGDEYRVHEPTAELFAHDLDVITSLFNVLPLPEAVSRLVSGTLPQRAACITFDDGYQDNHRFAAPILEKNGVPATFFIATEAVENGVMWNDLVIETMIRTDGTPDARSIAGFTFGNTVSRFQRLGELLEFLKYRELKERQRLAVEFYRANVGETEPRLMMTTEEVADLGRRGFDIGGHTVHHPILLNLPAEQARREIEGCRQWLLEVTGVPPRTFAYPNGIPGRDFSAEHITMVREAGFEAAVSTRWALGQYGTDPFSIPRIGPWWRQGLSPTVGSVRTYVKSYFPESTVLG